MNFFQIMSFGDQGWASDMLLAALMTCAISVCGFSSGLVIGCLGCWAKLSRFVLLRVVADLYTTILRGVPDLLVIYLFYFGSTMVLTQVAQSIGIQGFTGIPGFLVGVIAISVISGAYQLEVLRGAVHSVPLGTIEAGRSLGLGNFKLFALIVAPQALRIALPGLGNVWLLVLKDSALISVVGLVELMRQSGIGAGATHQPFIFYGTAAALYYAISTFSSHLIGRLEHKLNQPMRRS
ncbi:ABC transporter permease subunit [Pseudomonas sp. MWU16-30316]|uniref:ABC transporter permease n=1 Tax=Pseudomonas sp. MWU16-30316 TaxID=2878093 RepID=UPI0031F658B8